MRTDRIKYTTDTLYVDNAKGRGKEGTLTSNAADAETKSKPCKYALSPN
jgi:hypothetical protein